MIIGPWLNKEPERRGNPPPEVKPKQNKTAKPCIQRQVSYSSSRQAHSTCYTPFPTQESARDIGSHSSYPPPTRFLLLV